MVIQDPGQYYDETYKAYEIGWSSDHFHFGYWFNDTKNHEESLLNTTREVIDHLDIKDNDHILDAGCGTGGSSRFIADKYEAKVTGIMLSEVMLEVAKMKKKEFKHKDKLSFYNMDFTNTKFDDDCFDKIFGIESVCHANNKSDFVKEAKRLLKSGGKIVIADGYQMRDNLNSKEKEIYEKWLFGWALPNLSSPDELSNILEANNFVNIAFHDNSDLVSKSSLRLYRNARFSRIFYWITGKLNLMPFSRYYSARSAYLQHFLVQNGIVGHGILVAEKA